MTGPAQPKAMLAVAVLFAGAGLVLAQQAWVASPRVHVPPGVAYVVTALLFVAAEGVCRGAWGLCALICGVMTGWAIARHRARRRAD